MANKFRAVTPSDLIGAMGRRYGDTLTIANQWASVTITRDGEPGPGMVAPYVLGGDTPEARATDPIKKLREATLAALDILSLYETGRAD